MRIEEGIKEKRDGKCENARELQKSKTKYTKANET